MQNCSKRHKKFAKVLNVNSFGRVVLMLKYKLELNVDSFELGPFLVIFVIMNCLFAFEFCKYVVAGHSAFELGMSITEQTGLFLLNLYL